MRYPKIYKVGQYWQLWFDIYQDMPKLYNSWSDALKGFAWHTKAYKFRSNADFDEAYKLWMRTSGLTILPVISAHDPIWYDMSRVREINHRLDQEAIGLLYNHGTINRPAQPNQPNPTQPT